MKGYKMGYSTHKISHELAMALDKKFYPQIISASHNEKMDYFNNNKWMNLIQTVDLVDDEKCRMFFNLINGDFVEVEA